jgi:hypothetical protein
VEPLWLLQQPGPGLAQILKGYQQEHLSQGALEAKVLRSSLFFSVSWLLGVELTVLSLLRQVLYHLNLTSSPLLCWYF